MVEKQRKTTFIQATPGVTLVAFVDVEYNEKEDTHDVILRMPLKNSNDAGTVEKMLAFEVLKVKGR